MIFYSSLMLFMFPSGKVIFGNVVLILSIDLDLSIFQPTYLEPNILAPAPNAVYRLQLHFTDINSQ